MSGATGSLTGERRVDYYPLGRHKVDHKYPFKDFCNHWNNRNGTVIVYVNTVSLFEDWYYF